MLGANVIITQRPKPTSSAENILAGALLSEMVVFQTKNVFLISDYISWSFYEFFNLDVFFLPVLL